MSSNSATLGDEPAKTSYLAFVWYFLLIALAFWPVVAGLVYQWQNDEDMGHGFFVPVTAGFIAWERRDQWLKNAVPNYWGLAICLWGAVQLWAGTLMAELFLQRTALPVTLAGLVLLFGGSRTLRVLGFPLLLLLFMIPIPGLVYKQITFPLQLVSTQLAEWMLDLVGILVVREGNILDLAGQQLSVVEACSGLRALHALVFFSLTYSHFLETSRWGKWLMLGLVLPVTITANAGRVVTTGILAKYDPDLAAGIYHTISGWILFVGSITLLIGIKSLVAAAVNRIGESKAAQSC